jgi:hypothetical protein
MVGNDELENGIPQKLQTLIVKVKRFALEGEAGMGECLGEKEGITELVANVAFERIHVRR